MKILSIVRPRALALTLFAFCILIGASSPGAGAVEEDQAPRQLQTTRLILSDDGQGIDPRWTLTGTGMQTRELVFQLPTLELKQVRAQDQLWHSIEIEGAVIHGASGEPGLPVVSRLIAVPRGMMLTATVKSATRTTVPNLHLMLVDQPEVRHAPAATSVRELDVQVGASAVIAGQTVVPLTICPVSYDAQTQEAVVWTEVRVELDVVPDPIAASMVKAGSRMIPESFVQQLEAQVLGFEAPGVTGVKTTTGLESRFHTYVVVHSGHAALEAEIAPLLQWRREQGYHVIEVKISVVGGSASSIKTDLQAIYDDVSIPPLEFVTIIGDVNGLYAVPSWTESLSGYSGGGDHYYTMLDGTDILSDVHIGRISIQNTTELTTVVNKILGYEKTPPMDDATWFGRACLQGDPSDSGITTIYVNQWVQSQLLDLGWHQVNTTWSGNFAGEMLTRVGDGVSVYGYRGYLGTSGITNGYVNALGNGLRLPMALLPTCDSGSFVGSTTCRSEAWLRAPNGGAVAAIGTATIGTHTRYNNCYYLGTWDGLLNGDDHRIGVAHTQGKMALYSGYYLAEPSRAEIWAVWNNIMGDAATEMWTSIPQVLNVSYPAQVSLGAQALTVSVDTGGAPVVGAQVCLYRETDGLQLTGRTDASGLVVMNLPDLTAGSITVTVTSHDMLPHLGGLTVGQVDVFCAATSRIIDDGGDGIPSPGETLNLTPRLTNHGTTDAFGVTAEVTVLSGPAVVTSGSISFGTISTGDEVASSSAVVINVDAAAEDNATITLLLTATDGSAVWTSLLKETVQAPAFSVSVMDLTDFGGTIDPGESGRFELTLANDGSLDAVAVSAILSTDSPWIIISDDTADFGNIDSGMTGLDPASPFQLAVSSDFFGGHLATFELTITYDGGLQATTQCAVTVGAAVASEPTGPDAYGYYAFDNTDTGSGMAPVYDWVAIDPDHGAQGTDLGLTDFGWEQDDVGNVTLPFTFGYYGVDYTKISICSNGWLTMGETSMVFYRNFPLPSSHSEGAVIAPFWDNLNQTGNRKVYTWYDSVNHRFIIQWYRMPNHYTGDAQNFEVILLDPAYHPTATGDGMIIFQYEEVNNTDQRDGYATVGIQNADRTIGLNYTYWNQYTAGAATLVSGRAILFAPMGEVALPVALVSPTAVARTMAPDEQLTEYLHITNNGADGSTLSFELAKVDPATWNTTKRIGGFADDHDIEPTSLLNSGLTSTMGAYETAVQVSVPLHLFCFSPDDEWLMELRLNLPAGVSVSQATNFSTSAGDMAWDGQTGAGIQTTWGASSAGFLATNQSSDASVDLTFDSGLSGDVVLDWLVIGDNYGGTPHTVSGQVTLVASGPSVFVSQPVAGDVAVLGDNLTVAFAATNGPTLVDIALQRQDGGSWQTLATNISAGSSPWNWTVGGDAGPYGRIRVSDAADAAVFGLSGVFSVSRNLDWLQLTTTNGQVAVNNTLDLAFTLDSAGLALGQYDADIVFSSNGGVPLIVPVSLLVSDVTAVLDIPRVVTLLDNYPNPFNPQTMISFTLPTAQDVSLKVYSTRGRLVRTLVVGQQPAGLHHSVWDGTNERGQGVASGVYYYRLSAEGEQLTGKMVLTK